MQRKTRKKYVHLRLGLILASEAQAELITEPIANEHQVRFQRFDQAHDAIEFAHEKRPKVVVADYERFGAAGIYGLADFMGEADAPVILIVRDPSEWEREQFEELGVQAVFEGKFKISELSEQVGIALRKRFRIGSSDRLPVVTG